MKRPRNKLLRQVVPYIVLFGIVLLIFTIGFVIGRLTIPAEAVDIPDVTEPVVTTKVHSEPVIEQTVPEIIPEQIVTETQVQDEPWVEIVATAYCSCEKCCGVWATRRPVDANGNPIVYGAGGVVLQQGVSVAADTSVYPMGTQLEIEGLGTYTVHDRGGAIKGNRIDVYFENHSEAIIFGRKTVRVRVVK